MKSIKKIMTSLVLGSAILFGTAFNANAVVISQEVLIDGEFYGEFSFEMSSMQLNSGDIIDSAFDPNVNFVDMTHFFGLFGTSEVFEFIVEFNTATRTTELFSFDGIDDDPFVPFGYQYLIAPALGIGFLDTDNTFFVNGFSAGMSFGEVSVNTPATIALFSLAIGGVFAARRRS